MTSMNKETEPKKANRHTANRKLLVKTKTTFDRWYDFKNCQLKKPEANRLQKQQAFSSFPKPTATNEVEILQLKEVTNCVYKSCLN
mgnify:CR=1 FL=1